VLTNSKNDMNIEPLIKLLQVEIELLRTIEKLAGAVNTSTESFEFLYTPVDNWNLVMDLIGLPKTGELVPGFPNPFNRESFGDVFFDLHYEVLGDSYDLCKEHLAYMKDWIATNINALFKETAVHE
jgi:hypothetical protein